MSKKLLLSSCLALATLGLSSSAHAQHDLRAYLSEGGLDFIAQEVPAYVPSVLQPPTFAKSFACMDFEQRNTTVNMSIDSINIEMPNDGRIRVDLEFSVSADGQLYVDDLYACFGELTCNDSLDIRKATATLDYNLGVENGHAKVVAENVEFTLAPEDVDFELSECGFTGEALTSAVAFTEEWILGYLETKVTDLADEHLGPLLENMLDGFKYEGSLAIAEVSASLEDLELINGGVGLRIDSDITDRYAAAACIEEFDKGGPLDFVGDAPVLSGAASSHMNMAVNLGLVNKALYSTWRRGILCLGSEQLHALGLEIDLSAVGVMLPGFPPGTTFSLDLKLADYPRVKPLQAEGSQINVELSGVTLDLHGDRPDGSRNTLHVEVDVEATATIGIDPTNNAIIAHLDSAQIIRMVLEDERQAVGEGYDVARIIQLAHDHILPELLHEMGPMPLTGPAFSFGAYAVMLRTLTTNDAYLSAGLDLFKVPESDTSSPETEIVDYPKVVTNPKDAIVQVTGTDGQIPTDLLQYQVSIDDEELPLSFLRAFKVGEMGRSSTYKVKVAAVDLNGNVDPSPAEISLQIDGVAPLVSIVGSRNRQANKGPVDLTWSLSDDLSAADAMQVRLEVYELTDPADALSTVLIDSQELAPGATSATVELEQVGGLYRVEIHAVDEAGNDSISSLLLTIPSTGGCSVGGKSGAGHISLLLLALGFLALRRRRN